MLPGARPALDIRAAVWTRRGVEKIQGFMRAHAREGFADIAEAADAVARYLPHRPRPKSLDGLRKNLRLSPRRALALALGSPLFSKARAPSMRNGGRRRHSCIAVSRRCRFPCCSCVAVPANSLHPRRRKPFSNSPRMPIMSMLPRPAHMVAGDRNDVFSNAVETFLDRLEHAI